MDSETSSVEDERDIKKRQQQKMLKLGHNSTGGRGSYFTFNTNKAKSPDAQT